jgi:hypothetical protein
VPELSLQQREAEIVHPDRRALNPANENEVAGCPLIHEPEQVFKRTESAMHLRYCSIIVDRQDFGHLRSFPSLLCKV